MYAFPISNYSKSLQSTLVTEMRQVAAIEHAVRAMIMERRRQITSVITEPEPAIIHFKNTRKSGFVCITLLSTDSALG